MDPDFYTQQGVLDMQLRITELVNCLAAEKAVLLDPGSPIFFDGSMSLPEPGVPWKVTLHSHGKSQAVVLPVDDLADFKAGRLSMVPLKVGMALNALRSA